MSSGKVEFKLFYQDGLLPDLVYALELKTV